VSIGYAIEYIKKLLTSSSVSLSKEYFSREVLRD
jgi:hypothetical protein